MYFKTLLLFMLANFAQVSTAHASPEAEALIKSAASELQAGTLMDADLEDVLDMKRIARFTLGRHARLLVAEEVSRYDAAFKQQLVSAFSSEVSRFAGAEIQITGSSDRSARDSIVTTRVVVGAEDPLIVRWRVIDTKKGWRVVDVQLAGLWYAIEQRAQISGLLDSHAGDIDAVIAKIGKQTQ